MIITKQHIVFTCKLISFFVSWQGVKFLCKNKINSDFQWKIIWRLIILGEWVVSFEIFGLNYVAID